MSRKKEDKLKPTAVFTNILSKQFNTWHSLFYFLLSKYGNKIGDIPNRPQLEFIKQNRELELYKYDLDFIKARLIDEAFPIVNELFEQIGGGKNYSNWEQLLRTFYNKYQTLLSP